jgi:hypothetical protein
MSRYFASKGGQIVFDAEIRTAFAHERAAQLRNDMRATSAGRRRTRRAVGKLMIRVGDRLAREPRPQCREISSRA